MLTDKTPVVELTKKEEVEKKFGEGIQQLAVDATTHGSDGRFRGVCFPRIEEANQDNSRYSVPVEEPLTTVVIDDHVFKLWQIDWESLE